MNVLFSAGDGLVRLVGGTNSSGRVEAQYGGRWGRVCSAGWYLKDATVVCRQLGFTRAIGTTTQYVSKGTGEFLLADVNCGGGEDFLHNCSGFVVGLVPPGCAEDGSFGDAHVVCQTGETIYAFRKISKVNCARQVKRFLSLFDW